MLHVTGEILKYNMPCNEAQLLTLAFYDSQLSTVSKMVCTRTSFFNVMAEWHIPLKWASDGVFQKMSTSPPICNVTGKGYFLIVLNSLANFLYRVVLGEVYECQKGDNSIFFVISMRKDFRNCIYFS